MWYNDYAKQKQILIVGELSIFYGGFVSIYHQPYGFGKSADSAGWFGEYPINLFFVWRQSGFAFFGALTSVGALFYFFKRKKELIMQKTLSLILALILCLSLCACGEEGKMTNTPTETGTPTSLDQTETTGEEVSPEDSLLSVGDTAQGEICNVTVTSVEFVDKIENGFFEHMWIPATRDTYKDVTAEEGYSIVKIAYHFDYTGKASGNMQLKFELDYDDGYIFEGHGGHAIPKKSGSITYGFEEKYVFGEQTNFVINDPLSFQGKDAFTYIFVNDAVKTNTDKSFVLRITLPTTAVSETSNGLTPEEMEQLILGIPFVPGQNSDTNVETETVMFNLRED